MRTGATRRGWEGVALTLVLILGLVSGCGLGEDAPAEGGRAVQSDLHREVKMLLKQRVRAVRKGKVDLFLDGLVDDPVLRRDQRAYFENLRQLPLANFGYALPDDGVTASSSTGRVIATLSVVLELDGFDSGPVRTPTRMTLEREQDGVLRIVAARDEEYEVERNAVPQPWDTVPIEVLSGNGVLGIFDRDSWRRAGAIIAEVEQAITEVSGRVPYAWPERVVVYALSDTSFLARLPDLPGDDPERLDGVAFPVPLRPGAAEYAGTRFLLHPRILERTPTMRARLIRHELVHVALGQMDDRVPVWLSEGLAEYVSVRALAPQDRMIAQDAVAAARSGISALPSDAAFNGSDSSANYGVAWFACEHVAAVYGEQVLWRLFDEMRADGGVADTDQDRVLLDELGIDGDTLAKAAGSRIVSVFG
ncbi:hypothetical protein [Nocardioides alcanivorans]|uniref:hypothetical protein n=1 Tax=Nocardioides alcanivorans TaxID=2897352 RepID=UPI001F3A957F|nr:hypothetical protein [Nocardioides alcanivorans]